MKTRNMRYVSKDRDKLKRLDDEYRSIGYDTDITGDTLTVFSRQRKKPKRDEKKNEHRR